MLSKEYVGYMGSATPEEILLYFSLTYASQTTTVVPPCLALARARMTQSSPSQEPLSLLASTYMQLKITGTQEMMARAECLGGKRKTLESRRYGMM